MLSARGNKYATLDLGERYVDEEDEDIFQYEINIGGTVTFNHPENHLMRHEPLEYLQEIWVPCLMVGSYREAPFGTLSLRDRTAVFWEETFSPAFDIDEDHITYVSGMESLYEICALTLTNPGDGILLGMPIDASVQKYFQTTSSCQLVYTPFRGVDQFGLDAVHKYEEALEQARNRGIVVKFLFITNPHNPLGRCYSRTALKALLEFCGRKRIHLISDETHGLNVYKNETPFTSVLAIDPKEKLIDPRHVHVLWGFSRVFACPGNRIACIISQNTRLTRAVRSLSLFHWPSLMSTNIASTILFDEEFQESFLKTSHELLKGHQYIATRTLDDAGISYSKGCNAGYFLWIDLSPCLEGVEDNHIDPWAAERALTEKLLRNGIEMTSGFAFHSEHPGWFQLVFTVDLETLVEGLDRIVRFYQVNKPAEKRELARSSSEDSILSILNSYPSDSPSSTVTAFPYYPGWMGDP